MVYLGTNATGWTDLYNGHIITAVYNLFNTYFNGFFVLSLFVVFQIMLYIKSKNATLMFVTTAIFFTVYVSSTIMNAASAKLILTLLIVQFAIVLYYWLWK